MKGKTTSLKKKKVYKSEEGDTHCLPSNLTNYHTDTPAAIESAHFFTLECLPLPNKEAGHGVNLQETVPGINRSNQD